jgi:hypothetical protein
MDKDSFLAGFGESLAKSAGLTDWVRQNVYQPMAQGVIDENYRGLGTYNPQSGGVEPNTMNAIRAVTGQSQIDRSPDGLASGALYSLGRTAPAKWITNRFIASDEDIGNRMSSATKGVFSMGNGQVQVDRSKVPGLLVDKARSWMSSHGNLMKGVGLGAAAIGLGAMAFRKPKQQQQAQVAAPAGQAPAPYTNVGAGRRGNYFQKYQE